jgi:hypothetical protein
MLAVVQMLLKAANLLKSFVCTSFESSLWLLETIRSVGHASYEWQVRQ